MSNKPRKNPELEEISSPSYSGQAKRLHIVRQDRLSIPDLRTFLVIEGTPYPVINYSSFGIAISSPHSIKMETVVEDARLVIEEIPIQTVTITRVREEKQTDGTLKIAFEILHEGLNIERIGVFPEILRTTLGLQEDLKKHLTLPNAFVSTVYEMKDMFGRFDRIVTELHARQEFTSRESAEDFDNVVIEVVSRSLTELWNPVHIRIQKSLEGQAEHIVKDAFQFFRTQLKAVIYEAPFARRSLMKPRGYAGDYEMMNLIYRHENVGTSLFARCMERALLEHDEPQAVRNRALYLSAKLKQLLAEHPTKHLNILSVGCGPAMEIQKLLESTPQEDLDRLHIELLDQDVEALKHTQRQLKKISRRCKKQIDVQFVNKNIRTVVTKGIGSERYHLIYSAGLFDYFSDTVAQVAGKHFFEGLVHNGTLIIGNFDLGSPHKLGMEIVFDWNLIYRSRSDLNRLFTFTGGETTIEHEPRGINLFAVARKISGTNY